MTTTRVILISPRKWGNINILLKVHKVILQQKQFNSRVVKTATAGLPMEFLAVATLARSPNISGNPKREGGEAIATHGVMVTMLTVAQCLSLVQSIQNTSAQCKAQQSL